MPLKAILESIFYKWKHPHNAKQSDLPYFATRVHYGVSTTTLYIGLCKHRDNKNSVLIGTISLTSVQLGKGYTCIYLLFVYLSITGADPGIFVRGGPTFGKFWQAKKKKKKKEEEERKRGGGEEVFPFAGVWFKSTFQTIIYIQIILGRAWSLVQLQAPLSTHTDDMVVFIL